MKNIQLFAGPGTGKSTTAAGLFYKMKTQDFKVEYIQEFAKELTFSKDYTRLSDQLLILGEQHHRMKRLEGQVDFLIHDSPFVMGLTYLEDDPHLPKDVYANLITSMYASYDNLNIFLNRSEYHAYQQYGRTQTLEQAKEKDEEIKQMLRDNNISFIEIEMGEKTLDDILKLL